MGLFCQVWYQLPGRDGRACLCMMCSMLGLSGGDVVFGGAQGTFQCRYLVQRGPWWNARLKSFPSY